MFIHLLDNDGLRMDQHLFFFFTREVKRQAGTRVLDL